MAQRVIRAIGSAAGLLVGVSAAMAQWNPAGGQWGKSATTDLRVMTWNVQDAICSTNPKTEGANNWSGVARVIATLKPDVLIIQEAGDNSGNGTGSGVDSISTLQSVVAMLLRGGTDTYRGGSVTAYVQKYAPVYDLPYVWVSSQTDGYNRNIILSRYPFSDLVGNGQPAFSNFTVTANGYAPGGGGGIRGYMMAQINLPNIPYGGDLVMGNSHLVSGSTTQDWADRLAAVQNIAYFLDYYFNGAGTGNPNPTGAITSPPQPARILPPLTGIITGGDLNEDENTNGRRGPAEWFTQAATAGGTDGTDKDRTDGMYDDSRDPFNNARGTFHTGTTKADYVTWQDSVFTLRRSFTFSTVTMIQFGGAVPATLSGWPGNVQLVSTVSADHRPVIADFILPAGCPGDWDRNGVVDPADIATFVNQWLIDLSQGTRQTDIDLDWSIQPADLAQFVNTWLASLSSPACQ